MPLPMWVQKVKGQSHGGVKYVLKWQRHNSRWSRNHHQCRTARHHWRSSTMTAVCSECRREAGHSHRTVWTYHTRSMWVTLAARATLCRVQDSHTGVQGTERLGASIPGRRLQLGQRRHSPTTFSYLPHLYGTKDKDTARWQIIRSHRPTRLE